MNNNNRKVQTTNQMMIKIKKLIYNRTIYKNKYSKVLKKIIKFKTKKK